MSPNKKIVLPIIILIAGATGAWQLFANSPKVKREAHVVEVPLVNTMKVNPQSVRIPVYTQGTVNPRTAIKLSAEVSGRVVEVSPRYADGGFFKKGDMLVRLDNEEYQLAITKSEATVASAKQQLAKAEAEYKQKQKEYSGVNLASVSDFALRKPEFEEAKARLKAAEADLKLANLQLRRCTIYAPFDGRVVKTLAGLGQLVMPSVALAEIYAIDIAEIRLPISQAQSGLLDLPALNELFHSTNNETDNLISVKLHGRYAGRDFTWDAAIVRTDATIDERNRLQNLIAQVDDPYGMRHELSNKAPLEMGMFVDAEITGRLLDNIYVLPRSALHDRNTVWLLDEALKLRQQDVSIVHRGKLHVYVSDGLSASDRVITSSLDAVVDGMQLRVINPEKL